jgi:hypothetical protein
VDDCLPGAVFFKEADGKVQKQEDSSSPAYSDQNMRRYLASLSVGGKEGGEDEAQQQQPPRGGRRMQQATAGDISKPPPNTISDAAFVIEFNATQQPPTAHPLPASYPNSHSGMQMGMQWWGNRSTGASGRVKQPLSLWMWNLDRIDQREGLDYLYRCGFISYSAG